MTHARGRLGFALAITAALVVGVSWLSMPAQSAGQDKGVDSDEIRKLVQKRRDVLKQLVAVQIQEYRTGRVDMAAILTAQRQLLDAELELNADRSKHAKLLADFVELAKSVEMVARKRYQAAETSVADVLEAQAARLEAETRLLRARRN